MTGCIGNDHLPNPHFSSHTTVSFRTCTCRYLSTRSRWVSFKHSTWHQVSCTRTRGHPCSPFAWYAKRSGCVHSQPVSFITISPTPLNWSTGIPWSVRRAASCSRLSQPLTRTSKKGSFRCSWSRRAHPLFFDEAGRSRFPLF